MYVCVHAHTHIPLDHVEALYGVDEHLGLVALQPPDEVPLDVAGHLRGLLAYLLHVVLAKMALVLVVRQHERLHGHRLRHRHQRRHRVRTTDRTVCRPPAGSEAGRREHGQRTRPPATRRTPQAAGRCEQGGGDGVRTRARSPRSAARATHAPDLCGQRRNILAHQRKALCDRVRCRHGLGSCNGGRVWSTPRGREHARKHQTDQPEKAETGLVL